MSEVYSMNVRADEAPHEVLGTLPVPIEAVQGDMQVIGFRPHVSYQGRQLGAKAKDVFLTVCPFVDPKSFHGREYAIRVKRAEWPALKETLL